MDSSLIERELGLPPGFLDTKCTKEDILKIYQLIVYSKELASHLGLKDPQIHAVEHDARSEQEKSLMLLKTWKQTFSMYATYRGLINALLKINKSDTACEVCKALYPSKLVCGKYFLLLWHSIITMFDDNWLVACKQKYF